MEMLEDAMHALLSEDNRMSVILKIKDDVFWLCDKVHMTEVFANVLLNAVEAIEEKGAIDISGLAGKSSYMLTITDSGAGMSSFDLTNIYTPYFTTKSTEKNFGLGLAYCKNVLTKHGGDISVKSKPGKGTTVTISYPPDKVTGRA